MLPLFYFLSFFSFRSCTFFRLSCSFCISVTPPFVFLCLARGRVAAIFLLLYHLIFLSPLPPRSASYIIFSPNTSSPPSPPPPLRLTILPFSFPWFKFCSSSFFLCLLLRSPIPSRPPLHALSLSSHRSYFSHRPYSLHCLFPFFKFSPFRPPSIHYGVKYYGSLCSHFYFTLLSPFPSLTPLSSLFQSFLLSVLSTSFSFTSATFALPVLHAVVPLSTFQSLIFHPPSPCFFRHPPRHSPFPSLCHLTSLLFILASSCLPPSLPFLHLPHFSSYLTSSTSPFSFASSLVEQETCENYNTSLAVRKKRAINLCVPSSKSLQAQK